MSKLIKWLQENNFKFRIYDESTVMVDTNYPGYYPKKETYQAHDLIKSKCRRLKNLKAEPRGCYTGMLITAIK